MYKRQQFNDQKTLRNEFDDLILIPPPFFDEGPVFQRIHAGFVENEYRGSESLLDA